MSKPLVVFLAEDNRGDAFLVREALNEHGLQHQLILAEDGDQAVKFLEEIGKSEPCPDIILLDLNLPKREGAEVLHLFREHPECSFVPVIVITSSDSPRDRARAAELEANYYFRKPSEFEEFMKLGELVKSAIGAPTGSQSGGE